MNPQTIGVVLGHLLHIRSLTLMSDLDIPVTGTHMNGVWPPDYTLGLNELTFLGLNAPPVLLLDFVSRISPLTTRVRFDDCTFVHDSDLHSFPWNTRIVVVRFSRNVRILLKYIMTGIAMSANVVTFRFEGMPPDEIDALVNYMCQYKATLVKPDCTRVSIDLTDAAPDYMAAIMQYLRFDIDLELIIPKPSGPRFMNFLNMSDPGVEIKEKLKWHPTYRRTFVIPIRHDESWINSSYWLYLERLKQRGVRNLGIKFANWDGEEIGEVATGPGVF